MTKRGNIKCDAFIAGKARFIVVFPSMPCVCINFSSSSLLDYGYAIELNFMVSLIDARAPSSSISYKVNNQIYFTIENMGA
jgi:hypothetical protein